MPIHLRSLMELGPELGGRGKDGGRRTISRRMRSDPDFPSVTRINGRVFVDASEWENYEQLVFRRGLEVRPPRDASNDMGAR